jgi:hypothetical protein
MRNTIKIVDAESIKTTNNRGKKELNIIEKWLFDKQGKQVRLSTLIDMESNKAALVELSEFQSNKKNTRGIDHVLNNVFVTGEIALIARRASDTEIVIKKLEKFDISQYNKADQKEMSSNHLETVKAKLAETLG